MRTVMLLLVGALLIPAYAARGQEYEPDFSTPETAVRTFLHAVEARDVDLLAACFSPYSEGEFRPIIEKRVDAEMWAELADLFDGAEITGVTMREGGERATVAVDLRERDERLYMVKEDGAWRISGF